MVTTLRSPSPSEDLPSGRGEPIQRSKVRYDHDLDSLRGWAALSVVAFHVFSIPHLLDPAYNPPSVWVYVSAGHTAVMLFFCLSGYVIGLTNKQPFTLSMASIYIGKRLRRILPLYLIALSLAILAATRIDWFQVLGHLAFLQNYNSYGPWQVAPIPSNGSLWSLNYEMLYYLIFLGIWASRPRLEWIFGLCSVLGVAGWIWIGIPQFIVGYGMGLIFWLAGLSVAWHSEENSSECFPILGVLMLLYASQHFAPLALLVNGMGLHRQDVALVNVTDLSLLPGCLLLLAAVAKRSLPWRRGWLFLAILNPAVGCALVLAVKRNLTEIRWMVSTLYFALGTVLLIVWNRPSVMRIFNGAGRISYAIYLIHLPVILLFRRYFPWQGNATAYFASLTCCCFVIYLSSYFLEHKVQPLLIDKLRQWEGAT